MVPMITPIIIAVLPPIREIISIPCKDQEVICKYTKLSTGSSWYVFGGQPYKKDFLFWGLINNKVSGQLYVDSFTLSELNKMGDWLLGGGVVRDTRIFKVPFIMTPTI